MSPHLILKPRHGVRETLSQAVLRDADVHRALALEPQSRALGVHRACAAASKVPPTAHPADAKRTTCSPSVFPAQVGSAKRTLTGPIDLPDHPLVRPDRSTTV